MTNRDDLAKNLMLAGIVGVGLCIIWWFVFYSRVISFTGGGARDFSQAIGCLFYSSVQCVIIKGISSLAGYWPYEPFFLWLSGGAFVAGMILRSASANGGAGEPLFAPPRQSGQAVPAPPPATSPYARPSAGECWLISAILSDGQVLKFEISEDAPLKIIGRDPEQADVVIAEDSVSRTHARIEMRDGVLWISDLDSTNGTKIGDREVRSETQRLYPSDKLLLGTVVLTISTA